MTDWMRRSWAGVAALALALAGAQSALAQSSSQDSSGQPSSAQLSSTPQGGFVLKVNGELVLTNVVARDSRTGELALGLKQSDFSIYENGKQQKIDTFDFESVDKATPLNEATVSGLAAGTTGNGSKAVVVARPEDLRNHRLIVMFFDLTSMQPEDLDRSVAAAQEFLKTKMQPADLVALVSLGDTLKVDQDFTADKTALINEVAVYNGTEGQGFAEGATANSNQVEDTTGYTPTRASTTTSIPIANSSRCGRSRRRSRRSRRRSRCSTSPAASRATGSKTRPRCERPSTPRCAPTWPSTAWTRAACRRLAPWAMRPPAACAAVERTAAAR